MNADQFTQVRELYDTLIELPAALQRERLDALCGDVNIREEVLSLLARDEERATIAYAANLQSMLGHATVATLEVGDVVGVWKVTSLIGEGGMGTVYGVERSDGQFVQKAALKLLRGVTGTESLAAFTRERQIMARFAHPNIARLLDGGTTQDGVPYLVMEQVTGQRLDEHVRTVHADTAQRLQLIAQICDAVSFAHSQLVIHCDLKPSNILVTNDGRPMLLDFGIAALMDAEEGAPGNRRKAFTPRYASPELKAGSNIGTATDVFSLGCILAELLEGPLDSDLKAIVDRATADEVASRYASAAQLSRDIGHYLAHEPVLARNPTPLYVVGKLVRRRWPVFAVSVVVLAMVTFFVLEIADERNAAVAARKLAETERQRAETALAQVEEQRDRAQLAEQSATRERDLTLAAERRIIEELNRAIRAERAAATAEKVAQREAITAQRVSDFLESIFMGADPDNTGRQDVSAYALLQRARERVTRELADEPAVLSRIIERLAIVHEKIGQPQEAARIYDEAIAIERQNRPPQLERLTSLLIYAALFKSNNKLPGPAEEQARESLALREKHQPQRKDLIAQSLDMLALVISGNGRHEEAIPLMQRALQLRSLRTGRTPDDEIASSHHNLGVVYRRMGEYSQALPHYEIGTEMQRKRLGRDNPRTLNTAEQLGLTLALAGRSEEGLAILQHALETRKRIQGERSSRTALSARELGTALAAAGRFTEAVATFREAAAISAGTHGRESAVFADILVKLADALGQAGVDAGAEEAARLFEEALRICTAQLPPNDPGLADAHFAHGRFWFRRGDWSRARPALLTAERIWVAVLAPGNPLRSQAVLAAANLVLKDVDKSEARQAVRERLDSLRPHLARMFADDRATFQALEAELATIR